MQHTLTTSSDGIVTGTTYTFRVRARNTVGFSEFSNEVRYVISAPPEKPLAPTKDYFTSSKTSMVIRWSESAVTDTPIIGYKLYMSEATGEYRVVYENSQNALLRETELTDLITGQLYQFRVSALNFNGESVPSDVLEVYACNFPAQPDRPQRISGTKTSLLLGWAQVDDNGGCPITGYRLYRDDGDSSSIAIEVDPSEINNKPTLTQHNIAFDSSQTGLFFRFQLAAENAEGSSLSRVASFIIAQKPDAPTEEPEHDSSQADEQSLSLSLTPFTRDMNGGSEVIGYQMQIDDGRSGPFVTVLGADLDQPALMTLETQVLVNGLTKGFIYRVRYRAINQIGSGDWSEIAYKRAASVPAAPPTPIITFVDATQIALQLSISSDDGGTGIFAYHLYINEGQNGSPMNEITDYNGIDLSYTISQGDVVASHIVSLGNIYTIKYVAENAVGLSQDSDLLYVALASMPEQPDPPTFDADRSTRTKIVLLWQEGVSVDIPVTGYRLYSDKGLPGNQFLIYDGDGSTQVQEYTDAGLIPGVIYEYFLEVLNFNGPSLKSVGVFRSACNAP